MCKRVRQLYEFHFKMDINMEKELLKTKLYKKCNSLSKVIVNILIILFPSLEEKHIKAEKAPNSYEFINQNQRIKRKSIHVYLPYYLYRKLKLMHHDLNVYSIAQLLRRILRFFLVITKKNVRIAMRELRGIYRSWKENRKQRKYKLKSIRQLLHFIYQKPSSSRYLTIYDNQFNPISILLY